MKGRTTVSKKADGAHVLDGTQAAQSVPMPAAAEKPWPPMDLRAVSRSADVEEVTITLSPLDNACVSANREVDSSAS